MKQAIVWLEQQQTALVTMKCENEDMVAIETTISSIKNTIPLLNNLLTSDEFHSYSIPQNKIKPPKVLRSTIWFYIQHLYGMFPYAFFQYVNNESSSDLYLRDVVKVSNLYYSYSSLLACNKTIKIVSIVFGNRTK